MTPPTPGAEAEVPIAADGESAAALARLHALARALVRSRADCADYHAIWEGGPVSGPASEGLRRTPAPHIADRLAACRADTAPETAPLVEAAIEHRTSLAWWNPYPPGRPAGRGLAERAGATMLAGLGGPFTAPEGRAGLFYLGEDVDYAPHAHEAREIYAVLAGRARFWNELTGWVEAGAGAVVHTPERSWHAMATGEAPVLLLWAWTGPGIHERPILRGDFSELPA